MKKLRKREKKWRTKKKERSKRKENIKKILKSWNGSKFGEERTSIGCL